MAASQTTGSVLSYMPQPYEQAYYLGLFNTADEERQGQIAGPSAVKFFSRSRLPVDVLKNIWMVADNPPSNFLDHRKFAVAIRLIQLAQNGLKGEGANLAVPGGAVLKPAFFEGISGSIVPLPPPPPQQQQQQQQQLHQQQQAPVSPSRQPNQQQPMQPPTQRPHTQQQQQQQQQQQHPPPGGIPSSPSLQSTQMNHSAKMQPPTPPRPPHPHSHPVGPTVGYGALTVQDPFTLTPNDQARYEALFAEQCKEDGYVYGSEAVAFFGKSGLPPTVLGTIWNMSDYPVDNRLDKIEFCIAMHLIVCVSKKNLPLPPTLPLALKQLKSQRQLQPQPMSLPPQQQQPQNTGYQPPQQGHNIPAPPLVTTQQNMVNQSPMITPPPQTTSMGQPSMATSVNDNGQQYGSSWSVPHANGGAVDNGPSGVGNLSGLPGPPPLQSQSASFSISDAFEGLVAGGGDAETVSTYRANTPPVPVTASFDTNTSGFHAPQPTVNHMPPSLSPELAPIATPSVVQSSPMRVRGNSHRDAEPHRDTEELRLALQKLQAENISLKARLATINGEEEDVRSELVETVSQITKLSGELTTLRAQLLAAKSRLLEVTGELTAAKEKKKVIKDLIDDATATKSAIEEATNSIVSARDSVEAHSIPAAAAAPGPSYEMDLFDSWGNGEVPGSAPVAGLGTSLNQPLSVSNTSTYSFDSAYKSTNQIPLEAVKESEDDKTQKSNVGQPQPTSTSYFGQPDPSSFLPRTQLNREPSTGFGDIMGGNSGLQSITPTPLSFQSGSVDTNDTSVDELKKKANKALTSLREAENVAADSEATRRQVAAQADELRRLADEAEKNAREASVGDTQGKKKGLFGRGGKKHDAKEAEKLAAEARDRKDAFLQIQSQLNDATSLANETKAEVERLRKAAEDMEMEAASAESMQKAAPPPPSHVEPSSNGFGAPSYGFAAAPLAGLAGGDPFGNQSTDMGQGFNSNVMGLGGISIPTPSGNDPYSNPF